ncbi:MAG: ATP-binding protein [bacterium]|nr:ATP-binding protein [bacterium]
MQSKVIPPQPSSFIESIRSIGYTLSTALADVVDNSVAAQATVVRVMTNVDAQDLKIGILDDGIGMTEEELLQAMTLGSQSPLIERAKFDLGRFGLGLKTASFSQCRVLTVVTRSKGKTACARWNLDHISKVNKWEVQLPEDTGEITWADLLQDKGTLVLWERLDPSIGGGGDSVKAIEEFVGQMDEARSHLELVFHRLLSGDSGRRKIRIEINDLPLKPFDPFHSQHPATIAGPVEIIRINGQKVSIQAFTLPHRSKVSLDEWEHYARPDGYVRSQGFYVYRERRLIIDGTWFGLMRQSELTKLARVRIDMPNSLDEAWKIDVKKASAQLPPIVRTRLRRIIEPLGATSKRVYKSRGQKLVEDNHIPVWSRLQNKNEIVYKVNEDHPMVIELQSKLSPQSKFDFLRLIEVVGTSLPTDALFADLGGDMESNVRTATTDEALRYAALTTYEHLSNMNKELDEILTMMQVAEPFRSNWNRTEEILRNVTLEDTSYE